MIKDANGNEMIFECLRCKRNKYFATLRGLIIHAEVKRENGVLAILVKKQSTIKDD